MTIAVEQLDELVTELRTILRDEQILTSKPDRYNRARVPAPFPVHRWSERLPDLAVLPTSTWLTPSDGVPYHTGPTEGAKCASGVAKATTTPLSITIRQDSRRSPNAAAVPTAKRGTR